MTTMTDPPIPAITLPGRSGCRVEVQRQGKQLVIVKSTVDSSYAPRLQRQIELQRAYRTRNNLAGVVIPEVISECTERGGFTATMEYIGLFNCNQFLEQAGIDELQQLASLLWQVIEQELAWADVHAVPCGAFVDKIEEIRRRARFRASEQVECRLDSIRTWFESQGELSLPTAVCHGDLTLSNVLVSAAGDRIALIDFLDSFVLSPVLDMVKLRQDTLLGWSIRLAGVISDRVRPELALGHLDRLLHARFMRCSAYNRYHTGLQALNLARTLPYLHDASMRQFVITAISRLGF
jgi:tRNA A-37 threonylcarbamoyl transferase component Bud32